jgi:hypothetical protein
LQSKLSQDDVMPRLSPTVRCNATAYARLGDRLGNQSRGSDHESVENDNDIPLSGFYNTARHRNELEAAY